MLHLENKLIWGVPEQDMLLIAGYYIELTNLTKNNSLSFSDINSDPNTFIELSDSQTQMKSLESRQQSLLYELSSVQF